MDVVTATTTLLHSHGAGTWGLTLHFAEIDGRAECVGIDVRSFKLHEGAYVPLGDHLERVTASLFREIPIASRITAGRDFVPFGAARKTREPGVNAQTRRGLERMRRAMREPQRAYPDEHWTAVADVYRQAWRRGAPPTKAVREKFSVNQSTAAKWVGICRERELLPRTEQGRPKA